VANPASKKVAVVGAGWAGCAAAVEATRLGHPVTLFEASHHAGGRARRLEGSGHDSHLDNGQHILIGAYTETLALMRRIGVDVEAAFVRTPLQLAAPDGWGLQWPESSWWPCPPSLAAALAMLGNSEWTMGERLSLLRTALGWQLKGFACPEDWSVAHLCRALPPAVMRDMIEPLCVSALNTPAERASASVLLRVLHDALFAVKGGSDLLIPHQDLSALLPEPALAWLQAQGAQVRLDERVTQLAASPNGWQINDSETYDAVVLALPHKAAAQLVRSLNNPATQTWLARADALQDEAIATVYVRTDSPRGRATLPRPMLRLRGEPVQFVFDRGQLGNTPGTFALVASAPDLHSPHTRWPDNKALTQAALAQAQAELAPLGIGQLIHLQTVVEKRATYASTPGLHKPAMQVLATHTNLLACGDYVEGPYPATLEAAVRSGLAAASAL
jgi:squalene-associated FAD-dependent desaturase